MGKALRLYSRKAKLVAMLLCGCCQVHCTVLRQDTARLTACCQASLLLLYSKLVKCCCYGLLESLHAPAVVGVHDQAHCMRLYSAKLTVAMGRC